MTDWRALTIKQPWAWAICHAGKDVENRTWPIPPKYLADGPLRLMIHAGASVVPEFTRWEFGHGQWSGYEKLGGFHDEDQILHATIQYADEDDRYWRLNWTTKSAIVAVAKARSHPYFDEDPEFGEPCCRCLSPWGERVEGMHHWELSDVQVLATPVPASGRQKLWTPTAEVVAAVEAQCHSASGGDS